MDQLTSYTGEASCPVELSARAFFGSLGVGGYIIGARIAYAKQWGIVGEAAQGAFRGNVGI